MEATVVKNKVKLYASFKYSGEDWIGDVPSHWDVVKLKRIFREKKKTTNINLPCGSISYGKVVFKDDEKIPESTKRSYQVLSKGEFLINPLNLNYDLISLRIGLSDIDAVVSSGYIVLNSIIDIDKSYYKWLLHRYDVAHMKTMGSGVRQTISFAHIANSLLVFPPLTEQSKIAKFIDEKTDAIDKAIGIKEKQIELLKEHQRILIQNILISGLDSNVKLKSTGLKFLGDIPSHWEIKRFRDLFSLGKGLTITKENLIDEGIHCVNYGEIHSKFGFEVNPEIHELKCVSEHYLKTDPNSMLRRGDFIFADTSEDVEGSGNFTYLNSDQPTFAGYHTVIARPKFKINSRFFAYLFDSLAFRKQIRIRVKGVKVFSITQSILKEPYVWLPTKEEQDEIVNYLDKSKIEIEQTISLKKKEIDKLKEYKSTLINSAVTGKIKVC